MNEMVSYEQPHGGAVVPVAVLRDRVRAIKELVQSVFVENVHFGVIPYTNDKKVLLQPGADQICALFRIAPRYHNEDLSTAEEIRYRVTCQGVNQAGEILGEGMGEASTGEEKYRWRRAVCDEEFEATPETKRRVQYKKSQGGHYKVLQIMTNPADSANTILKMAAKRARVAMVLTVTGCSDDFSQDEEILGVGEDKDAPPPTDMTPRSKPKGPAPKARDKVANPDFGLGERKYIERRAAETGADVLALCKAAEIESLADLTPEAFEIIKGEIAKL